MSDEAEECRHGLDVRWCALCLAQQQNRNPARGKFRRGDPGILAQFDGTCPECGYEIEAGVDRIVTSEMSGEWKHARCP